MPQDCRHLVADVQNHHLQSSQLLLLLMLVSGKNPRFLSEIRLLERDRELALMKLNRSRQHYVISSCPQASGAHR